MRGRLLLAMCLVVSILSIARADVIHLKAGGKLEGEILREDKDEVELKLPYGSMVVKRADIAKIEKKPTAEQELAQRRAALGPVDAAGRVVLAKFALDRRVPRAQEVAASLALEAWTVDPASEEAVALLKKLDHHYDTTKETWVAPTVWYPANGFVRRDARWMSNEEAAHLDAAAATRHGRAAVVLAEKRRQDAEESITRAQQDEAGALQQVRALETELAALRGKTDQAKLELDARENDLRTASVKVQDARRTTDTILATGRPKDPAGGSDYDRRLSAAQTNQANAEREERRARDRRDVALVEVKRLIELESSAPAKISDLKSAADAARVRATTARESLPSLTTAIERAQAEVTALETAEHESKKRWLERRVRDRQAEEAREAALKKKAGK